MGGWRNEIIPDQESDAAIGRGAGNREDAPISIHVLDFRHLSLSVRWHGGAYESHRDPEWMNEPERVEALSRIAGKRVTFKFRRTNGERIAYDVRAQM